MSDALDFLVKLLDIEPIEVNIFRGVSPDEHRQRVFGGQVAAQALMAAGRTVEPAFAPRRFGELQRSALAVERAKIDLGWQAGTRLADGIRAVYEWIEAGAPDRAGY